MFAQVVPLRRVGAEHDWFTYRIPDQLDLHAGDLVEVPFGRENIRGVVWEVTDSTSTTHLKSISRRLLPQPVMTEWQMRAVNQAAQSYGVGLNLLVARIVPIWSKRDSTLERASDRGETPVTPKPDYPDQRVWWYRDRTQAEAWIQDWLRASHQPRLVLAPTIEAAEHIAASSGAYSAGCLTSRTSTAEYRRLYQAIRSGQVTQLVGSQRALFLPWPTEPKILIDQEEHPAHKQHARHPRLDTSQLVPLITSDWVATTPAPSVRLFSGQPHLQPMGKIQPRHLVRLDQPRASAWVSPEVEAQIQPTLSGSVLVIVPQRDFAQSVSCRDCEWQLRCQHCHRPLGLTKQPGHRTRCRLCQQFTDLQSACPRCGSVAWKFSGLGLARLKQELITTWPATNIQTSWPPVGAAGVWLGTYQAYQYLNRRTDWRAVVVINGDALRAWPDYSADERAWQYLARLQAHAPSVPIWVQTYAAEDTFWQRWLHTNEMAWYQAELEQRRALHLPPWYEQWIVRWIGPPDDQILARTLTQLAALSQIRVQKLPAGAAQPVRLLVQTTAQRSLHEIIPIQLLPSSLWQIDRWPRSWLD